MSADYDNTNTFVLYPDPPRDPVIGNGTLTLEGDTKKRLLVTEGTTNTGKKIRRVYMEVGAFFDVQSQNEKAPIWSGPLETIDVDANQMSGWLRKGSKGDFISGTISVRQDDGGGKQARSGFGRSTPARDVPEDLDDDIPF